MPAARCTMRPRTRAQRLIAPSPRARALCTCSVERLQRDALARGLAAHDRARSRPRLSETPGITTFTPAAFSRDAEHPLVEAADPRDGRSLRIEEHHDLVALPERGRADHHAAVRAHLSARHLERHLAAEITFQVLLRAHGDERLDLPAPSAQRGSIATTRPWTIARAPVTSSPRLAGRITVASSPTPARYRPSALRRIADFS